MNMSDYKIAICDDTEADRNYIKDLVTRWAHSSNLQIDIHLFSSAELQRLIFSLTMANPFHFHGEVMKRLIALLLILANGERHEFLFKENR